jgi:acid phosphatase type 7
LVVTRPCDRGGNFRRLSDTTGNESAVTWNTAPAGDTLPFVALGSVTLNSWIEVDLQSLITGDGAFAVRVVSTSWDGAEYSSTEAASNKPHLVLTVE